MFIGHFAVGLGAKKYASSLNLGVLFIACQLLDLIWPVLVLIGVERVSIEPGATAVNPFNFEYYPISHSLGMAVAYSLLLGSVIKLLFKSTRAGMVFGFVVLSHWLLDYVTHRPDLPVWINESKVGLGMWNSLALTFIVELSMFAIGIFLFFKSGVKLKRRKKIAFWSLVAFLLLIYCGNMFGPKLPVDTPPGMIAGPAMAMWIIVVWGYYIDWSSTDENSDRRHRSIHFKKGIFRNEAQIESKSLLEYVKARHSNVWAKWPSWLEADYGPIPSDRVDGDELLVTLVNHSTVLIQGYGYNVITDPIFSKRCSPVQFAGPKRVRNPGIRFSDLPKIDLVLVSHDHYDHLDLDTIHKLAERDHCKVLVGLGVGERLSEKVDYAELDWWEDLKISQNLKATFVPVQHFSGRSLFDRDTTLWGGFVLELGEKKIYFGGDTGYADHFKNTSERFGSMDLSLIPIGAYAPRSFMAPMHINPKEAVTAHFDLRSKKSIGIHYGTFQLTAEGPYEPTQLLKLEAAKAGVNPEDFVILEFGHPMKLKS